MSHARQLRRFIRRHPQPSGAPRRSQPHVKLALAATAHHRAAQCYPTIRDGYANADEDDANYWASEAHVSNRELYLMGMGRGTQEAALDTLRTNEHARIEAWRAVRKAYPRVKSIEVRVFGLGWEVIDGVVIGEWSEVKP